MLSADQLETFRVTGMVRIPGAFDPAEARRMEEMVWRFVARSGGVREDRTTWPRGHVPGLSPKLKRTATFQLMWSEPVTDALTQLLDGEYDPPRHCGSVLVTYPNADRWEVPHSIWHADTHFLHEPEPLFGVKTYSFVNEVGLGQGGTCVLSGGHHLVTRFRERNPDVIRSSHYYPKFMKSDPWLADLATGSDAGRSARLLRGSIVDGHEIRIVELTGQPGDVVLTHPWTLHCIATNAADEPRMMTSKNIFRHGIEMQSQVLVDAKRGV